jgi:hypothetical protein
VKGIDCLLDQEKGIGSVKRFRDVIVGAMSGLLQIDNRLSYPTQFLAISGSPGVFGQCLQNACRSRLHPLMIKYPRQSRVVSRVAPVNDSIANQKMEQCVVGSGNRTSDIGLVLCLPVTRTVA